MMGRERGYLERPLRRADAHGGAFDFWPGPLGEVLFYASQALLAGAVVMTMWSGWEFVREVRKQRRPHAP